MTESPDFQSESQSETMNRPVSLDPEGRIKKEYVLDNREYKDEYQVFDKWPDIVGNFELLFVIDSFREEDMAEPMICLGMLDPEDQTRYSVLAHSYGVDFDLTGTLLSEHVGEFPLTDEAIRWFNKCISKWDRGAYSKKLESLGISSTSYIEVCDWDDNNQIIEGS